MIVKTPFFTKCDEIRRTLPAIRRNFPPFDLVFGNLLHHAANLKKTCQHDPPNSLKSQFSDLPFSSGKMPARGLPLGLMRTNRNCWMLPFFSNLPLKSAYHVFKTTKSLLRR